MKDKSSLRCTALAAGPAEPTNICLLAHDNADFSHGIPRHQPISKSRFPISGGAWDVFREEEDEREPRCATKRGSASVMQTSRTVPERG